MRATVFNLALFLDRLAALAPACLYGYGVCLLGVKITPHPAAVTPWRLALAAGLVLLAGGIVQLFRLGGKWYDGEYALAWLDLHNRAGGAILARGPDGGGNLKVRPGTTPGYFLRRLSWPAVFVLAAWLVPAPEFSPGISGAGAKRDIADLARRVETAAENRALPPPDAEEIRRQIRALEELAEKNPEAASEAVAALRAGLDAALARRLERGADAMEKTAAALGEAERAADARSSADAGSREEMAARLDEMFKSLDRLERNEGGPEHLPPEMREALSRARREAGVAGAAGTPGESGAGGRHAAGVVERETLGRLLQALEQNAGGMAVSARAAGLAEGAAGRPGGGEGALRRLGSAAGAEGEGLATSAQAMAALGYGSGGVSRGPGDAPLLFGDESAAAGARFEYKPLPAGRDFVPGQILGRERVRPDGEEPPGEFRPAERSGAGVPGRVFAGSGGAALGPERARAAERYFRNLGGEQ